MNAISYMLLGAFSCAVIAALAYGVYVWRPGKPSASKTAGDSRYREIVDHFSGVIYSADTDGIIDFVSPGVLALMGYYADEVVGRHYSFLVDPDSFAMVAEHYVRQLERRTTETTLEFRARTRTGRKKWVEQIAVLREKEGVVAGFQCFVRDISETKALRLALETTGQELEDARKVEEQFLANMSHEIRTPMNGIQGMARLLRGTELTAEQKEFVGTIHQLIEQLGMTIDDILDYTKIKTGERGNDRPAARTTTPDNVAQEGLLNDLRFLIVEDNPINQQITDRALRTAGASVAIAGDGEEAVRVLERERFDLIIMDLQMPVMDGYEATRQLRGRLGLDTPILAMTAGATQGGRRRCLAAGMNDYMLKPFEVGEFYLRITQLLKEKTATHYMIPSRARIESR
jgi:PAS domain S-box-containing protein